MKNVRSLSAAAPWNEVNVTSVFFKNDARSQKRFKLSIKTELSEERRVLRQSSLHVDRGKERIAPEIKTDFFTIKKINIYL